MPEAGTVPIVEIAAQRLFGVFTNSTNYISSSPLSTVALVYSQTFNYKTVLLFHPHVIHGVRTGQLQSLRDCPTWLQDKSDIRMA